MSMYAIMRFEKCKKGSLTGRERHNERKKEEYASNKDIDKQLSHLNYHFIGPPPFTYTRTCQERIKERNCPRIRKDSTYMVETLYTASPEFFKDKSPEQIKKYFEECVKYASETFGYRNIISAVVHMDEKTPHMHLCFVPITEDGRLSAKDILGNQKQLSKHQDKFYEYISRKYPELKRGQSAMETHRKHVPTWLLKQAPQMQKLFDSIEKTLDDLTFYNTRSQKEKLQKQLKRMLPKLKSYVAEVEKLRTTIYEQEQTIEQMREKVLDAYALVEKANAEKREIQEQIERQKLIVDYCQDIIQRIPKEVLDEVKAARRKEMENRSQEIAATRKKRHEEVL